MNLLLSVLKIFVIINFITFSNCGSVVKKCKPVLYNEGKNETNFIFCDDREILQDQVDTTILLMKHMEACHYNLSASAIEWKNIHPLFVVENVKDTSSKDFYGSTAKSYLEELNLTDKPAIVTIVHRDDDSNKIQVHQRCFSPFLENANIDHDIEYRHNVSRHISNLTDFTAILIRAQIATCSIIYDLYLPRPLITESLILWVLFGSLLLGSGSAFIVWIYKFHKSHPTAGFQPYSELPMIDSDPASFSGQGYVITSADFEVVSYSPTQVNQPENVY